MRPNVLLGLVSLVLFFVGASGAEHCTTYSTSDPEVTTTGHEGPVHYVDNDLCQFECVFAVWIYEESNGIDGLQRGDAIVDDTCHGLIDPDTRLCALLPMALLTPRDRKERKAGGAALAGVALLGAVSYMPTVDAC